MTISVSDGLYAASCQVCVSVWGVWGGGHFLSKNLPFLHTAE